MQADVALCIGVVEVVTAASRGRIGAYTRTHIRYFG
jgi:hypothetical protein